MGDWDAIKLICPACQNSVLVLARDAAAGPTTCNKCNHKIEPKPAGGGGITEILQAFGNALGRLLGQSGRTTGGPGGPGNPTGEPKK